MKQVMLCLLLMLPISACNTVHGAATDMNSAADSVEDAMHR